MHYICYRIETFIYKLYYKYIYRYILTMGRTVEDIRRIEDGLTDSQKSLEQLIMYMWVQFPPSSPYLNGKVIQMKKITGDING